MLQLIILCKSFLFLNSANIIVLGPYVSRIGDLLSFVKMIVSILLYHPIITRLASNFLEQNMLGSINAKPPIKKDKQMPRSLSWLKVRYCGGVEKISL